MVDILSWIKNSDLQLVFYVVMVYLYIFTISCAHRDFTTWVPIFMHQILINVYRHSLLQGKCFICSAAVLDIFWLWAGNVKMHVTVTVNSETLIKGKVFLILLSSLCLNSKEISNTHSFIIILSGIIWMLYLLQVLIKSAQMLIVIPQCNKLTDPSWNLNLNCSHYINLLSS